METVFAAMEHGCLCAKPLRPISKNDAVVRFTNDASLTTAVSIQTARRLDLEALLRRPASSFYVRGKRRRS